MHSMRPRSRSLLGFLLLLAVFLPAKVWRSSLEGTLWMDETYTLVLVERPTAGIVRLTGRDSHPPLYYLGLDAWLGAGRALGIDSGILWARSLNTLFWVLAAAAAWVLGRRSLGPSAGTLLAWSVAAAAGLAQMAQDLRSYGFASAGLAVCFLLLLEPPGARGGRWEAGRWSLYAASAAFALWSHLLSGLVLACLGLVWAALAWRRTRRLRTLAPAVAAHAAALLAFLPWLVQVPRQLAYLERVGTDWMTPATVGNLLLTLVWWLPFGRLHAPTTPAFEGLLPMGIASLALPVAGWVAFRWTRWARGRRGPVPEDRAVSEPAGVTETDGEASRLERGAVLGLGAGLLFVLLLWGLARSGLAPVFHGPRYPLMASAAWAGGLACLAAAAARRGLHRRRARAVLAWGLMAPWLAAGLIGPIWSGASENRTGLASALAPFARDPALADLYVMPPEILPFFRGQLSGFRVHPIEQLPCDTAARPGLQLRTAVLALNPWVQIETRRDRVARRVIERQALSHRVRVHELERSSLRATLYVLENVRPAAARYLCEHGFAPRG
jgi:hypothetical protein